MPDPDHTLDTLLDLDGQTWVLDEPGTYWIKFEVRRIPATPEKPHGLDYAISLHGPGSGVAGDSRLVCFDNAHGIKGGSGPGARRPTEWDHKHRFRTILPYEYEDAAKLLEDYFREVDAVLAERGISR